MINLVICNDKPILINKRDKLSLLSKTLSNIQDFSFKDEFFSLRLGEAKQLTPDVRINFFQIYQNKGISLGFSITPNTIVQRSLGKDKDGRHLWYFRKKVK